jgi:hypothetical protein
MHSISSLLPPLTAESTVTIEATDPDAAEAGPDPGEFRVSRGTHTAGDLPVAYTIGGTADPNDYTELLDGSVTIADGSSTTTLTVTPYDDTDVEGGETVILTLAAGSGYVVSSPEEATVTIADDDSGGSGVFQQDSGSNGLVSMEAENYNTRTARSSHDWSEVTSPEGYSGAGAMEALPNSGIMVTTSIETTSPEMTFEVNFVKTGTHYIWVRGHDHGSGADDSIHFGLGGSYVNTLYYDKNNLWTWKKMNMGSIASVGQKTINLWMREDGFVCDKIVLTTNGSYTPTGTGPPESPQP